ncbi:unnamed protein product [Prunus armeniaca]|uniref:Uncharacterized protein n=1 Tax=Prunus armeniaca TaxID=36596 RepID=A0A6J5X2D0_PRUAR|nr:unnamed protein product [Prunus armeniaca]
MVPFMSVCHGSDFTLAHACTYFVFIVYFIFIVMEKNVSIPLCNVLDKVELCTLELHHFVLLENDVYKGGKVLVLYYHDPTHNNELENEDEEQEQHSEDVGN